MVSQSVRHDLATEQQHMSSEPVSEIWAGVRELGITSIYKKIAFSCSKDNAYEEKS